MCVCTFIGKYTCMHTYIHTYQKHSYQMRTYNAHIGVIGTYTLRGMFVSDIERFDYLTVYIDLIRLSNSLQCPHFEVMPVAFSDDKYAP